MSAFAASDQGVFDVALHNQQVRELVKQNESHALFDDRWADVQYCQVAAKTEDAARAAIERDYPQAEGFVVDRLTSRG